MSSVPIKTSYGTAWIKADGSELHRTDGPAVEYDNGKIAFFVDGVQLTLRDWIRHPGTSKEAATFWGLKATADNVL